MYDLYSPDLKTANRGSVKNGLIEQAKKLKTKYVRSSLPLETTNSKQKANSQEWNQLLGSYDEYLGSNPPTSGSTVIYEPWRYEDSNKAAVSKGGVTGSLLNTSWYIMTDFSGYNSHCTPTAATNLMYYYKLSGKMSRLFHINANETFKKLHTFLKSTSSGTLTDYYRTGLLDYASFCNVRAGAETYRNTDHKQLKAQLDKVNPAIFNVYGHYIYGGHSMLGLAYEEYKYSSGFLGLTKTYSVYIRVADGWSRTSNRFVHFTAGGTGRDYTTFWLLTGN